MSPPHPTVVLTGGTSGIGQCTAVALAQKGADLVLTARSKTRADSTIEMIERAAPGTKSIYTTVISAISSRLPH
jgi:short-subunit dehydrogenase